jgi:hypothetical protein
MSRSTWIAGGLAAFFAALSAWLYIDRRDVEDQLAKARVAAAPAASSDPWAPGARDDGERANLDDVQRGLGGELDRGDRPELPAAPKESRLERRLRRQAEVAGFLGREAGESEEDYRARVMPMLEMMLGRPRENVSQMRKDAEALAGVTPEQSAQIDAAFDEVYDELLTYTNAAIADRQLDPYERNVAGMLEYAGGLGQILQGAEGRVGGILSATQMKAIYDSGFEWGEYLGVSAPWEKLTPPPPPPEDPAGGPGGGS